MKKTIVSVAALAAAWLAPMAGLAEEPIPEANPTNDIIHNGCMSCVVAF